MMERSPRKGHHARPGHASTPRFLGKIGHVKDGGGGEGSLLGENVGAHGPGATEDDEATERAPWLRVGVPSEGDINHVAQVWHS